MILVWTACVLAKFGRQELIKISPDIRGEDYELKVVHKGSVDFVTFVSKDGEAATSVFTGEGFKVERKPGSDECLLKQLDRIEEYGKECRVKEPMLEDDVPDSVAEFCAGAAIFAEKPVLCSGLKGRKRRGGCSAGCGICGWGVCCGYNCD